MNFNVFYNWLKYTIVTPSFFFKNRLFIEKSMQNRNIYADFSETHKSFTWSQIASTNVDTFWAKASRSRFKLYIFLSALIGSYIFLRWINVIPFPVFPAGQFFAYTIWRLFDGIYFWILQFEYLFITFSISLMFMIVNVMSSANLSLTRWMEKYHAESPSDTKSPTLWNAPLSVDLVNLHNTLMLRNLRSFSLNENGAKITDLNNLNSVSDMFEISTFIRNFYQLTSVIRTQTIPSISHTPTTHPLQSLIKTTTADNLHRAKNSIFLTNLALDGQFNLVLNTEINSRTRDFGYIARAIYRVRNAEGAYKHSYTQPHEFIQKYSLKDVVFYLLSKYPEDIIAKTIDFKTFDNQTISLLKTARWTQLYNSTHKSDLYALKTLNSYTYNIQSDFYNTQLSNISNMTFSSEWAMNRFAFLNNIYEANSSLTINSSTPTFSTFNPSIFESPFNTPIIASSPLNFFNSSIENATSSHTLHGVEFWLLQNYFETTSILNNSNGVLLNPFLKYRSDSTPSFDNSPIKSAKFTM